MKELIQEIVVQAKELEALLGKSALDALPVIIDADEANIRNREEDTGEWRDEADRREEAMNQEIEYALYREDNSF